MRRRLAYYAHDHGSGHLRNAANIATNPDFDVIVISGAQPGPLTKQFEFVHLESDVVDGYVLPENSPFHYVPTGAENVQRRSSQLHDALTDFDPDVVVVDVSAEVTAFVKLCGFPTIVRRMPGNRGDRAHMNMYDSADGLIAYYPELFEQSDFPLYLQAKTTYAGTLPVAFPPHQTPTTMGNRVVVLTSLGGTGVSSAAIVEAARRSPDWMWTVVGKSDGVGNAANVEFLGVVDDPAETLASADVIVTATGFNAVRAVAGLNTPLILAPEVRPFEEQQRFAESLAANSDAFLLESWDQNWASLLTAAKEQRASLLGQALFVGKSAFDASVSELVERVVISGRPTQR